MNNMMLLVAYGETDHIDFQIFVYHWQTVLLTSPGEYQNRPIPS